MTTRIFICITGYIILFVIQNKSLRGSAACLFFSSLAFGVRAQESSPPGSPATNNSVLFARATAQTKPAFASVLGQTNTPASGSNVQTWNWHVQNTVIVQGDFGFPAKYSGPASLNSQGEVQETATLDLFAGVRLWHGAEAHMDGLLWQGFGLAQTHGVEAFPNGDAYKAGTKTPEFMFARLFIRQTIGLGGELEDVPDDQFTLAGKQDISRLTFTLGRFSPLDICDHNTYAQDQHTQFMNWAMMGNLTWDYGQDTIGYDLGLAVELNQPNWALRYGVFQMPRDKNGFSGDDQYFMLPPQRRLWPVLERLGNDDGI